MQPATVIESLAAWGQQHTLQLLVTLSIIIVYVVVDRLSAPRIAKGADEGGFKEVAGNRAIRIARTMTGLVGLLVLGLVWGIEFGSVLLFAGTALTLLGVALFASWSVLSNVTAYFILLLRPTFSRGTFIRIIDVDNYAEGYITDVTPFSVTLITENREIIVYPNNLVLGRPTLINPRDRLNGVGKLPPHATGETQVPG